MDISSLQAFVAVARCGSFSDASEILFITQPAVSKRVASLEQELGVKLFNRIARQTSLTEAGRQLFPRAEELIVQADDMQRYASNLSEDISGKLSVAISHHIGLRRMPPILKAFNKKHTAVTLDIRFEDSDQGFSEVERGDIEFAVITLPSELSNTLDKQLIWVDDLHIVVSRDHPLAQYEFKPGSKSKQNTNNALNLTQLADYACVLPSKDTETHQIILREFVARDLPLKVQMETNNLETLKMLATAGLGWSLLPSSMVDSSMVRLDVGLSLQRELGMVLHSKRSLSNAAKALKLMIEKFADKPLS